MKSAISIKFKTDKKKLNFFSSNNCFFLKNWPFFSTSAGQNTTFSLPKDVFSYRNPFDNSLTVKNWNPKKMIAVFARMPQHI